jgi:hypothetical protein
MSFGVLAHVLVGTFLLVASCQIGNWRGACYSHFLLVTGMSGEA